MNAGTAGHAGTPQLRQLNMVNIDMFRHPKYYKELRKLRNKSDQAISSRKTVDVGDSVRPGPGHKLGEMDIASSKHQATSDKHQASSAKLLKEQATSVKPQA